MTNFMIGYSLFLLLRISYKSIPFYTEPAGECLNTLFLFSFIHFFSAKSRSLYVRGFLSLMFLTTTFSSLNAFLKSLSAKYDLKVLMVTFI